MVQWQMDKVNQTMKSNAMQCNAMQSNAKKQSKNST